MTIYVDELFAVNLLMDGLMLWAAGKLLQRKIPPWRLVLASFVGALYGVLIFLPSCRWLANGTAKAICACLMTWMAFGWISWKAFLKAMVYLYLVSFAMGGSTIALMYFFGERIVHTWSGIALVEVEFRVFWLIGGVVVLLLLVHCLRSSIQQKLEQKLQIVPVTAVLRGKTVKLRLLVDSGNCLTDAISGTPVVIVQQNYANGLFSGEELMQMHYGAADAIMRLPDLTGRIRLLPYQTVGYRGLMLGVRLDKLLIDAPKQEIADVILAMSPQTFAADGSYQGIISPALL